MNPCCVHRAALSVVILMGGSALIASDLVASAHAQPQSPRSQSQSTAPMLAQSQAQSQAPSSTSQSTPAASDSSAREYYSANGLLNRGLYELAAQEYRKFLAEHPTHGKAALARYGLGVALFKVQKYAEAADELEPIAGDPAFQYAAEVQLILGQSRMAQQEYAKAADAFERLLKHHEQHESADIASGLRVESLYRAGLHEAVDAACEHLVRKWPNSAMRERAEFFAGLAAVAIKNDSLAARRFSSLREQFPDSDLSRQAAILLAQALHRGGNNAEALRRYQQIIAHGEGDALADSLYGAAILLQESDPAQASKLLDRYLAEFAGHRLSGSALLVRGRLHFEAAEYPRAQERFEQALHAPAVAQDEAQYWIAKCHMRQDRSGPAADLLQALLRQFPDSRLLPEISYDRAVALVRSGDSDAAAAALEEFSKRFPKHALAADALYLHATVEHQRKQYQHSAELCAAFLKSYAEHPLAANLEFTAAENQLMLEDLASAIDGYQRFLARHPKHEQASMARYRMGTAMFRSQRFEQAQQALQTLVDGRNTPEPYRRALLLLGDIHFQAARWHEAIESLGDYVSFGDQQPSVDDALLKMGLAQARLNQADQALETLGSLIERFPDSQHRAQAHFERGQLLGLQDQRERAVAEFEIVVREHAGSKFVPFALHHLGAIAMKQQDYARAAELFAQLTNQAADQDQHAEALFQRGQALMAARQFAAAESAFDQLQREHGSHARVPLALAQRAIALARERRHQEALDLIQQIERTHLAQMDASLQATLLYEKAWTLRELKQEPDAAGAYRALLQSHDDQAIAANALIELAELESAAGQHEAAAELLMRLRQRIERDASVPADLREQALYRLAACRFQLEAYDQCAALSDEFIRAHPQSQLLASAHLYAGESRFRANKLPEAAPHFAAIVEKFPDSQSYETSLLRLGECLAAAQQWRDSEAAYQTHRSRFPDSELWFQAQFGIAWAKENLNQHDDAIETYRQVIERHSGPTAARAQFQIGECLFAKRQFDDAIRELLKVDILYAYPQWSAAALYEAGRCFEELGKHAEAQAQFEQVQERFPDTRWGELAAKRLTASAGRTTSGG